MAALTRARASGSNRRHMRRWLTGYLFVSPVILGLLLFTALPLAFSLFYSFTRYDILSAPRWVGLQNYQRLLVDARFWMSLRVTFTYALVAVPLGMVLSGLLSLLLHRAVRGTGLYRAIFYLPVMVPPVATAVLFADLYNVRYGIINAVLRGIGLPGYTWISRPETALQSLIVMSLWGIGSGTIIWLAGLQSVPRALYEAAEIDGAGPLRQFWNITIPLITPVIFFNLILGVIGGLQLFTQAFVMTGGGPADATLTMVLNIYNEAFKNFRMGYASAIAWVLFAITAALATLIFRSSSWVYYEGEQP